MDLFKLFSTNMVLVLTLIGMMAFLVSVITEVTKNLWFFKRIPTDAQVILFSVLLCIGSYISYASYLKIPVEWFYVFACIIAAFIVAFVAMFGWDKLTTLYERFKK